MGQRIFSGYTGQMSQDAVPLFESGDLTISPDLGVVRNLRGESVRLGPVNMRVLALLLSRAGQVVSRTEVFESVWTNQEISDDALTRCISDIRAELGRLSRHGRFIETLPKRGYRWVVAVSKTTARGDDAGDLPADAPARADGRGAGRLRAQRLTASLRRLLGYLLVLVLIASGSIWLIAELTHPAPAVIAVLPTRGASLHGDLAATVDRALTDGLMQLDRVDLLSRSAVDSRPANPFPYFYYEFGARWLVESELRDVAGETVLTVGLVDARAGIVLFQAAEPVAAEDRLDETKIEHTFGELRSFIEIQLEP